MEILAVKNLSFKYPLCSEAALEDISFSVAAGDFVTVCGATGSGKSTLLRMFKKELTPFGEASGEVLYKGAPLKKIAARESAGGIGFVMQRPEQQIVTDKVWHELAFGLENLGVPSDVIRRRVSEMSSYFGIEEWFDKGVCELSGGQKQLLNLASVMVMQPEVLILDEPTAQLDPIASSEFLTAIKKLNTELALTVIIVEHSLEEIISVSDKLLVLDGGRLTAYGETREICEKLCRDEKMKLALPAAARVFGEFDVSSLCPLSVTQGRRFIESSFGNNVRTLDRVDYSHSGTPVLEMSKVWFRYSKDTPDVLCGTDFTVYESEIFCLLGGNGSGKTTAINAAAGLLRPYSGEIKVFGKKIKKYLGASLYNNCLALLPQDVQTVFLHSTVREELSSAKAEAQELPYNIDALLDKHPYDLSGGEQQLAALAKVLAAKPRLLLLDEPTKGLDAGAKAGIAEILKKLKMRGVTIVVVTHDIEFAAEVADRCALFFRGEITCCGEPHEFFGGNSFYTTAANRMTRGYYDSAVTVEDAVKLCRMNMSDGEVPE